MDLTIKLTEEILALKERMLKLEKSVFSKEMKIAQANLGLGKIKNDETFETSTKEFIFKIERSIKATRAEVNFIKSKLELLTSYFNKALNERPNLNDVEEILETLKIK